MRYSIMDTTDYVPADECGTEMTNTEGNSTPSGSFNPSWISHPNNGHAQILSVISCVITASATVFGIIMWKKTGYLSILAYGLENLIDFLSTLIILWRFFPPKSVDSVDVKSSIDALLAKEKRASVGVSLVMLLLGIQIVIISLVRFKKGSMLFSYDIFDEITFYAALPSILLFGGLTMMKLHYANKLNSAALRKDGFCSAAGTILSLGIILEKIVSDMDQNIWYLDPLIAFIVGLACLFIGARAILLKNRELPLLSLEWWTQSVEDLVEDLPEPAQTVPV